MMSVRQTPIGAICVRAKKYEAQKQSLYAMFMGEKKEFVDKDNNVKKNENIYLMKSRCSKRCCVCVCVC